MEMSTFYVHGGVVVRGKDHLTEIFLFNRLDKVAYSISLSPCFPVGHLMVCAQQEQWW